MGRWATLRFGGSSGGEERDLFLWNRRDRKWLRGPGRETMSGSRNRGVQTRLPRSPRLVAVNRVAALLRLGLGDDSPSGFVHTTASGEISADLPDVSNAHFRSKWTKRRRIKVVCAMSR